MTPVPDWTAFDWLIAPLDRATFLEESGSDARRPSTAPIPTTSARSSVAPTSTRSPRCSGAAGSRQISGSSDPPRPFPRRASRVTSRSPPGTTEPRPLPAVSLYAAGWTVVIGPLGGRWPPHHLAVRPPRDSAAPPGGGQPVPHTTRRPGVSSPRRHPRRLHRPGRGRQDVADVSDRAANCRSVDLPFHDLSCHGTTPKTCSSTPATCCMCPAAGCTRRGRRRFHHSMSRSASTSPDGQIC